MCSVRWTFALLCAARALGDCQWWYEKQSNRSTAWRNVRDFGAVGDGIHDDTAAIQAAIDFNQTGGDGIMLARSPTVVYLPAGVYKVSDTLVVWYWGNLVGNPLPGCSSAIFLAPGSPGFNGSTPHGAPGPHKPVIATNNGFAMSTSAHAWWVMDKYRGGNGNDMFYYMIKSLKIVVGAGNAGAVGIFWPVAQQTAIRDVVIDMTTSGAIGIDQGGNDYTQAFQPYFNAGGGGIYDKITVLGGSIGLRLDGSQWTYRDITITGSSTACVQSGGMLWSMLFVGLKATNCPVAVQYNQAQGSLLLVDSVLGPGLGSAAITRAGSPSQLYLQNVAVYGQATANVVSGSATLPTSGTGATFVSSWLAGPAVVNGKATGNAADYLPLPSVSAAVQAGIAPRCNGGQNLCGGSAEYPETGIPDVPRPDFTSGGMDGSPFVNVRDYGAVGDGVHDDTDAIRAALAASRSVYVPSGVYAVSDTLVLPCNATVLGDALAGLALVPSAPGYGDNSTLKAMVQTSDDQACSAALVDLSLTTLGPGNDGALLLDWRGQPWGGLWDVTIRLYWAVGLKARFSPPTAAPADGGMVLSNAWFWAADHNLTDMGEMNCTSSACVDHKPVNQTFGVVVSTRGPSFLLATDFEHSLYTEYHFSNAANVVIGHSQTENTPTAVVLQNTTLVTMLGSLQCLWETRLADAVMVVTRTPEANCVQASTGMARDDGHAAAQTGGTAAFSSALGGSAGLEGPAGLDVSYRMYGMLQRQTTVALQDSEYSVPGSTNNWAEAGAYLNTC